MRYLPHTATPVSCPPKDANPCGGLHFSRTRTLWQDRYLSEPSRVGRVPNLGRLERCHEVGLFDGLSAQRLLDGRHGGNA